MVQHPITTFHIAQGAQPYTADTGNKRLAVTGSVLSPRENGISPNTREFHSNIGYNSKDYGVSQIQWQGEPGNLKSYVSAAACHIRGNDDERYLYRIDLAGHLAAHNATPRIGFGYIYTNGGAVDNTTGGRVIISKWLPLKWTLQPPYNLSSTSNLNVHPQPLAGSWLVADQGGPQAPPTTSAMGSSWSAFTTVKHAVAVFIVGEVRYARGGGSDNHQAPVDPVGASIVVNAELSIDRILAGDPGIIYRRI